MDPHLPDQELLQKYLIRPRGLNEAELKDVLLKKMIREFSKDLEIDVKLKEVRDDYIDFYAKHHGTNIKYYSAPGQGWEQGVRGQLRLLELKGESFKLPDINDATAQGAYSTSTNTNTNTNTNTHTNSSISSSNISASPNKLQLQKPQLL